MVHPVESLALSLRDVCLAACRSSQPTDSGYDVGSHALARLRVDEFPDPTDNSTIVQHCVPSRFQALCDAFRDARGQSDQDLVGKAFDFDFESTRGKLSMQEYGMGHALQRGREQERPSSQRCCLAFPMVQALCFALVRGRCTVAIALRSHQVSCQIVDMAPQPAWTRRRREHLLEDAYGTADEAGEY